jgi:hypothetical protein
MIALFHISSNSGFNVIENVTPFQLVSVTASIQEMNSADQDSRQTEMAAFAALLLLHETV